MTTIAAQQQQQRPPTTAADTDEDDWLLRYLAGRPAALHQLGRTLGHDALHAEVLATRPEDLVLYETYVYGAREEVLRVHVGDDALLRPALLWATSLLGGSGGIGRLVMGAVLLQDDDEAESGGGKRLTPLLHTGGEWGFRLSFFLRPRARGALPGRWTRDQRNNAQPTAPSTAATDPERFRRLCAESDGVAERRRAHRVVCVIDRYYRHRERRLLLIGERDEMKEEDDDEGDAPERAAALHDAFVRDQSQAPTPRPSSSSVCARCGATPPQLRLKRCARCRAARYCGPECQRAHWREGHRAVCAPPPPMRVASAGGGAGEEEEEVD